MTNEQGGGSMNKAHAQIISPYHMFAAEFQGNPPKPIYEADENRGEILLEIKILKNK
jgi:hypothetical protein